MTSHTLDIQNKPTKVQSSHTVLKMNTLFVFCVVVIVPIADQGNDPKIQDVYEFDENSTDSRPAAVSAEQTPKQTPQQATTTTSVPPREAARTESSPPPACQNHTLSVSHQHRGRTEESLCCIRHY